MNKGASETSKRSRESFKSRLFAETKNFYFTTLTLTLHHLNMTAKVHQFRLNQQTQSGRDKIVKQSEKELTRDAKEKANNN